MEVVFEASPASTQEMEIEEELKKCRWMMPNTTGTKDIKKKESPEQKRIQNVEKQMENMTVHALFIDTEEMTFKEEENDNQADLTKKMKTTDTKNKKRNKKPQTQASNKKKLQTKTKNRAKSTHPNKGKG